MIAADDRGFTLGDGLFETLLAVDGRPRDWGEHMVRLAAGCGVLGLPEPVTDDVLAAVQSSLAQSELTQGRAAIRVNWSAGRGGRGLDRPTDTAPVLIVTAS